MENWRRFTSNSCLGNNDGKNELLGVALTECLASRNTSKSGSTFGQITPDFHLFEIINSDSILLILERLFKIEGFNFKLSVYILFFLTLYYATSKII